MTALSMQCIVSLMKTTNKATIETVIQTRYGVSPIEADAVVVEWAASHLAETVGVEKAAKAWRKMNAKREKMGRYTSIPQWGTPFWTAYFAR